MMVKATYCFDTEFCTLLFYTNDSAGNTAPGIKSTQTRIL